uniref:Uncharacterized protein n=1 Tax=Hanusia phi TaxID=3032 RepID=A0A7S0EZJ1_9CRYP|mmetsp:Transcript_34124/g.76828  ORF Transcript_34124/g.76828 Transcript_34124/m.76828 type:complete len:625 (+) Transcript_34124:180-2054(+)
MFGCCSSLCGGVPEEEETPPRGSKQVSGDPRSASKSVNSARSTDAIDKVKAPDHGAPATPNPSENDLGSLKNTVEAQSNPESKSKDEEISQENAVASENDSSWKKTNSTSSGQGLGPSVVGEIGSMRTDDQNQGAEKLVFEPRATPRTVFKEQNNHSIPQSSLAAAKPVSNAAAARPPRPPSNKNPSEQSSYSVGHDLDMVVAQFPDDASAFENGDHKYEEFAGILPEGDDQEETGDFVKDGDPRCRPGASVYVSKKWLHVQYFKELRGLRGVLTRKGVNGAAWYASFPGRIEQAFSTGLHGQYVLCYAESDEDQMGTNQDTIASDMPVPSSDQHSSSNGETKHTETSTAPFTSDQLPKPNVHHTDQKILDEWKAKAEQREAELKQQAADEEVAHQLQPQNKDSVQDASVAVATDAPLAAPRGGKHSARGLGSARAAIGSMIGQGSARLKERPPSARSRAQMGAPPLGSGRISARRAMDGTTSTQLSARRTLSLTGVVTPDIGMSPRDDLTPESPRDGGRVGRLFKYPEWDEYELFDSDDLWSEHAYLLYGEVMGPGQGPAVFIWIGQFLDECDYLDDDACDRFALKAAREFQIACGGNIPIGPIHVVKELEEEEDFWEYFVLG